MAIKICIQAGHVNKGGGAPEELANNKRIADRVCGLLRERKFEVYQTDYYAYNDTKVTKVDYALFLALHCDMDYPNDGGSGFADFADPKSDLATNESQRICKIINDNYFKEVGINYKNHSNANTRFYYVWKYLTAKTPCVLLEMGQSIDPHDKVLLANTELIASGIVRSICKAFNVSYEIEKPVVPTPKPDTSEIDSLKAKVIDLENQLKQAKTDFTTKLAVKDTECENNFKAYKEKTINFINSLKKNEI